MDPVQQPLALDDGQVAISLEEVQECMSERGQVEWNLAAAIATRKKVAQANLDLVATNQKLRQELARLMNASNPTPTDAQVVGDKGVPVPPSAP